MESSSDDELIVLSCNNPKPIEPDEDHAETVISTTDIQNWDLSTILCFQTVRIQVHRQLLSQQSSYFQGLLGGSFSESNLKQVSIGWNLETFVKIMKFIHGCSVEVTSSNFLSLYEAALYYGVERLLLKCTNWFHEVSSSKGSRIMEVQLDDLIRIWSFGVDHAYNFFPDLCARYLAKNFMWAMSNKFFAEIPYKLLLCCVKHPHLTVYSEMHLSEALLVWLDANEKQLESLSKVGDDCTNILKQIRTSLLPLCFVSGKKGSSYFSKIADESVKTIFRLIKIQAIELIDDLGDGSFDHLKIRLSEYSKILDLSGCPQLTSVILILSLLPCSFSMDHTLRQSVKQFFINLEHMSNDSCGISRGLLPILSFEGVEEVDISKCARLNVDATIECFSKAFPSLRKLRAAYLLNFKIISFCKLVQNCPRINEVDLTVDVTPILHTRESFTSYDYTVNLKSVYSRPSLSDVTRVTRLTLEGRSEIYDSDLQRISQLCASLEYINLKGCISVTDFGISDLIHNSSRLNSLLVCDTSFGRKAVLALCVTVNLSDSHGEDMSLAYNLKTLHMGGCKGVDEGSLLTLISRSQTLKSLCLRDTCLVDNVLFSFSGSSLEALDVSDTKISGVALAYIIHGNPSLKCLKARGCKNLIQQGSNTNGLENSSLKACKELYGELSKKCVLEEIALGWSFSWVTLEVIKPALMSLRAVTIGLGGSLDENALRLLSTACPMLERLILYFQVISDAIVIHTMTSLRCLQEFSLHYCLGDISISSFKLSQSKLTKLRLQRVAPWMTNNDLTILTENFSYLSELSLLGCRLLNSDSLHIISRGWPSLISFHLEDCGEVTANGVSSLFNLRALEDLLLRHNGRGISRSFILDAASEMPMLRLVSLDLCDACDGEFDLPGFDDRYSLSCVKIAKCKLQRSSSKAEFIAHRRLVHEETLVLVWNSRHLIRTVVKERL